MTAYLIATLITTTLRERLTEEANLEGLTLLETAHLVALLVLTVHHTAVFVLAWSTWRRRRSKRARMSHCRKREHPTP